MRLLQVVQRLAVSWYLDKQLGHSAVRRILIAPWTPALQAAVQRRMAAVWNELEEKQGRGELVKGAPIDWLAS